MKRKNGFISTTVLYSFFVIFIVVLVYIVNNYTNNRIITNSFKQTILDDISDTNFARYLMNNYTDLGLTRHNDSLNYGADDESYRYSGSNVDNYVCFSSYSTCTEDNMYRVIGVINGRVKLIKATSLTTSAYATNYVVASGEDPADAYFEFSTSTIYSYLNTTYLTSLGDIVDYIETTTWYTGGVSYEIVDNNEAAYVVYDYELGANRNESITTTSKIALPYASDYGYASASTYYNNAMSSSANWMYTNSAYWLMTPVNTYYNYALYITSSGTLAYDIVTSTKEIRPVFFLKNTAEKTGGSGTKTDPYIINIV